MHGSRTNDVKTPRDDGRACDFFVGISGRNLICLIGVGPAGWEIAGAKFEQSCILERRKFIGVTPVSSTTRQSLIFVANIARNQVRERESIANSRNFPFMRVSFFSRTFFYLFFSARFCSLDFRFLHGDTIALVAIFSTPAVGVFIACSRNGRS